MHLHSLLQKMEQKLWVNVVVFRMSGLENAIFPRFRTGVIRAFYAKCTFLTPLLVNTLQSEKTKQLFFLQQLTQYGSMIEIYIIKNNVGRRLYYWAKVHKMPNLLDMLMSRIVTNVTNLFATQIIYCSANLFRILSDKSVIVGKVRGGGGGGWQTIFQFLHKPSWLIVFPST